MTTEQTHTPVWMVWRDGLEPTPNTYGPFPTRAEADAFLTESMKFGDQWGGVYDAVAESRSVCGPWLP